MSPERPSRAIKREGSPAPLVKAEPPAAKSSSEILSELFGAFNAAPPDLRDVRASTASPSTSPAPAPEARRRAKKKHKKENKRSRRSSSASSGSGVRSTRKHKHKKKKTKKERRRSPSRSSRSLTPALTPRRRKRARAETQSPEPKQEVKLASEPKVKQEEVNEPKLRRVSLVKAEDNKFQVTVKNEDLSNIPMPASPKHEVKLSCNDLRLTLDSKHTADRDNTEKDPDKSKNKIQIKNLKFSAVFEETVKKAEEEARKKAEKYEEGEYTDSSSGSSGERRRPDPDDINKEFPKSSDPGGILQKKSEDKRRDDKVREKSRSERKKHSPSHRSSRRKSRERSRSQKRSTHRSRSRHRSRSKDRKKTSSRRSASRSRRIDSRHPRIRLGRRSRSPAGVRLADTEKRRLLEVARRNAINMLKNGAVPAAAAALPPHTRLQVMAAIQSGGKSVDELTDFCKHLSKKEALGELSSVSSGGSDMSENEDTHAFHHPFLVKEKAPIVMNIRGGAPLPVKSSLTPIVANKDELRIQFPVSSGSQHRVGEHEWRPVTPPSIGQVAKMNHKHPPKAQAPTAALAITGNVQPPLPIAPAPASEPAPPPSASPAMDPITYMEGTFVGALTRIPAQEAPGPQAYPPGVEPSRQKMDMSSLVSQKLLAIRKQAERNDFIPASEMGWGTSSKLGQFTGSTGVQILTPRELASGNQAWAKKDQLVRAAPVEGGMGMHLLQKMGWTPGRGLGKEETGALQPLLLEIKLDTKGLQAKEEIRNRFQKKPMRNNRRMTAGGVAAAAMGVSGKHPVSLLGEYCSKRKLGPPEYQLCFECGPDHKKNFLFKVKVAGVEYQPAVASINKKQAKADSAQIALQKLGILP